MSNTTRVDKALFEEDHYLGKPADDTDRIITRRIEILEKSPEFFGQDLNLIEVGCGSGATINRLANKFHHCVGIDIYDYTNNFEQSKAHYQAVNSTFKHIDLELEVPSERFDRLISFEVIEHLRTDNSVSSYNELL